MNPKTLRLGRGLATLAALVAGTASGIPAMEAPKCPQDAVSSVAFERFYCVQPQLMKQTLEYAVANPTLYTSDAVTKADAERTCAKGTIRVIMVTAPMDIAVDEL